MFLSSRYTLRFNISIDFPNCISLTGNLIPNFAASLLRRVKKLSNDLLESLHIPMQSSMNLLKKRMASTAVMLGLAMTQRTQWSIEPVNSESQSWERKIWPEELIRKNYPRYIFYLRVPQGSRFGSLGTLSASSEILLINLFCKIFFKKVNTMYKNKKKKH